MDNLNNAAANIPDHLREFVVEQDQSHYQPIDHAVWRYILRQLKNFLSVNAHDSYLEGLEKTGITVDSIPSIDRISAKLQEFGWSAVPVSGFIPPAAFMELQSLSILPIATDMRSMDHILYTPAPDIVHEAAGHAPILVNPEFASYLKQYALVAKNAIVSSQDLALYEAIRELSDIKEHPSSTLEQIETATQKLEKIGREMTVTSEATLLGRMNWWTAEYGLFGDIESPKIYGAGLLSSYGEAKSCLEPEVKKIHLSLECIQYNYDITEPQPQLFVTPTFAHLKKVLHELSLEMAYKKGGTFGLDKAIEAKTVNTVQLNSGLQISGVVADYIEANGDCIYYRLEGPTQLCIGGHELPSHGKDYHSHGFSSPLGFVDGFDDCLSWASSEDLEQLGLVIGKECRLQFESGVLVTGTLTATQRTQRRELCLLSFSNCLVKLGDRTLFDPSWGTFDMAVGSKIDSVFAGPADRKNYGLTDSFAKKKVPQRPLDASAQALNQIYEQIRELRNQSGPVTPNDLEPIAKDLEDHHPQDWLARLEILEIGHQHKWSPNPLIDEIHHRLEQIKLDKPEKTMVIDDGLAIAHKNL
jgi:phenylalanine-4-hydroxylase